MAVTPVRTMGPGPEELRVLKPTLRLGTSTRALRGPGWPGKLRLSVCGFIDKTIGVKKLA